MPSLKGLVQRGANGFRKQRARATIPALLAPLGKPLRLELVGTGEGAWTVPVDLIGPDWICYCVGVGLDASFDQELASRFRASVYSFDPTPVAIGHMKAVLKGDPNHHFVPVGMWSSNTTLRFFSTIDPSQVCLATRDIHGTGQYIEAEVATLRTLMGQLGHDRVDLLKIDIEGSWDEVIDDLTASAVVPKVLCVEFDTPTSPSKVKRAIDQLGTIGLRPVHQMRDNVLFLREDLIN